MKKNDIVRTTIVDMNSDGEGIGKVDGIPLFIKDTVIGDEVSVRVTKLKKNYGYGRLEEIITPSPDRIEARCPIARACGGCQLQSMSYEKQLEFKQRKVVNNLKRIGGLNVYAVSNADGESGVDGSEISGEKEIITETGEPTKAVSKGEVGVQNVEIVKSASEAKGIPVFPVLGMENPWRYRNKAQLPVGKDANGKCVAGFYAGRTHHVIAQQDCLIADERNQALVDRVLSFMDRHSIEPYDEESGKGLVRHILIRIGHHTGEIMVCLIINGRELPFADELVEELKSVPGMTSISLNINTKRTNVILGEKCINLYGNGYITDRIGDITFRISPLSFFQVNPTQTEKLYETALKFADLSGDETVWDLYCGIGTISLFLARRAKLVRGVEIIPQAIEDAKYNAALNGFTNTEFYVGKAEEVLPSIYEKEKCRADVIVVDPPRKGCDAALLETIVKMQPDRVVYVSCDSATLARDLKWFAENRYETKCVQPVDMFSQGVHVESVARVVRAVE